MNHCHLKCNAAHTRPKGIRTAVLACMHDCRLGHEATAQGYLMTPQEGPAVRTGKPLGWKPPATPGASKLIK